MMPLSRSIICNRWTVYSTHKHVHKTEHISVVSYQVRCRKKEVQYVNTNGDSDFNVMSTQRCWMLNMYDTDFGPVGNDIYANFKQQSLGKEAGCKNIAT